jgi:hypothetical protein
MARMFLMGDLGRAAKRGRLAWRYVLSSSRVPDRLGSMLIAMLPILVSALDTDPWDLVRVDVPGAAGALVTSSRGSLLLEPPTDGTPWRVESVPVPDAYTAWEAREAIRVDDWHAEGFDGRGVRLAVFDIQWFQAELVAEELGGYETHDCAASLDCELPMDTFRPLFSFEEGSHGVACAETVRDVAPGVELHLVRVNGLTTMENAVDWAVREHIDLISMSMSFFSESFYDGSGAISETAARLADGGVLLASSAGNYAKQHWLEDFRDTDLDGYHEFEGGSTFLPIYLDGGSRHRVIVNWDQYDRCGDTDVDAYVLDAGGALVGRSEVVQSSARNACQPVERVSAWAERSGWYYLTIRRSSGDPIFRFSVQLQDGEIWQARAAGSLADPASSPTVFSVGAARASTWLQGGPESFSSRGPTHGGLPKPDITGPDGLSSSIYGETGFYGTSAAAPATAATLAVIMSRYPEMDAFGAARWAQEHAVPRGASWEEPDMDLGAGYLRLPPLEDLEKGCGDRPLLLSVVTWLPLSLLRRRLRPVRGDARPSSS